MDPPRGPRMTAHRTRSFALVAAVLLAACGTSAVIDKPNPPDVYDQLLHRSGMWNQMASVAPNMQGAMVRDSSLPPGSSRSRKLLDLVAVSYAPDRLRTTMRQQLALTVSPQDATDALKWYN